jgi:hypothetical protein
MGQTLSGTASTNTLQTSTNVTNVIKTQSLQNNNKKKVLTGQPGNVPKKSDPTSLTQGGGYKKKRTQHKMHTTRKTHKRRK